MFRLIFLMVATVSMAGCADSRTAERRKSQASSVAHTTAKKTEHGFRKAGGHLQKFFTGRDTITK